MAPALLAAPAAPPVRSDSLRRLPDAELAVLLADLRPAPRRPAELVALRAGALGLAPHPSPRGRLARNWPFLIVALITVAYLTVAQVIA